MDATVLTIEGRQRQRHSQIASLSDFATHPGGAFDAAQILDNPDINLYCLDPEKRQAIFAELPPGIDLARVPFYYQAQHDHALRLIAVSYETLHSLAAQIEIDPARVLFVHNVGRCGSTLLNSAFNQVNSMVSFSEPDVFSNFVTLRYADPGELRALLESCLWLTFRPAVVGQAAYFGLKLRNQSVDVMDLYVEVFPQAKHLFLYRSAVGWVASIYRLSARHGAPPAPRPREEALAWQAAYYNRPPVSLERFYDPAVESYTVEMALATGWLIMMDRVLELYAAGVRPLALRYEDLNAQPQRTLEAIFAACGLPASGVAQALQAFARDAQEDTSFARDAAQVGNTVRLSDAIVAQIQAILNRHGAIQTPDYVLPSTLRLD